MLIDAHEPQRNTLPWDIVFWVFISLIVIAVASIVGMMVGMR